MWLVSIIIKMIKRPYASLNRSLNQLCEHFTLLGMNSELNLNIWNRIRNCKIQMFIIFFNFIHIKHALNICWWNSVTVFKQLKYAYSIIVLCTSRASDEDNLELDIAFNFKYFYKGKIRGLIVSVRHVKYRFYKIKNKNKNMFILELR